MNRWRIGVSEAGLAYFLAIPLPPPDVAVYRDASQEISKSRGGVARHGYKSVTLQWNRLTAAQGALLRDYVQDALDSAGGVLFLTIDRANGTAPTFDWIDVSGRPQLPEFSSSLPTYVQGGHRGFNNVSLRVNNLSIVNDPSTV